MNRTFRNVAKIYNDNIQKVCKYYRETTFYDYEVCNFENTSFANTCNLNYKTRRVDLPIRLVSQDVNRAPALGAMYYPRKDNSLRGTTKRR